MLQSAAGQASKIYISDPLWHTVAPLQDILAGALLPQSIFYNVHEKYNMCLNKYSSIREDIICFMKI